VALDIPAHRARRPHKSSSIQKAEPDDESENNDHSISDRLSAD